MNLFEATYLVRFLSNRRLAAAFVTNFLPDNRPDYVVVLQPPQEPLDLSELGQAVWMLGFRLELTPEGRLVFGRGDQMTALPMADEDDPQEPEVEDPMSIYQQPQTGPAACSTCRAFGQMVCPVHSPNRMGPPPGYR